MHTYVSAFFTRLLALTLYYRSLLPPPCHRDRARQKSDAAKQAIIAAAEAEARALANESQPGTDDAQRGNAADSAAAGVPLRSRDGADGAGSAVEEEEEEEGQQEAEEEEVRGIFYRVYLFGHPIHICRIVSRPVYVVCTATPVSSNPQERD